MPDARLRRNCYCGSAKPYRQCCGIYHNSRTAAPTAEKLMRSRYSAYVLRDDKYLHKTWHPSTRPSRASLRQLPRTQWISLRIVSTENGGRDDDTGLVEFVAQFNENGICEMRETSRFVKRDGKWLYVDGVIEESP